PEKEGDDFFHYYRLNSVLSAPLRSLYGGSPPDIQFLTREDRAAGQREWKKLQSLPPAPDWLGEQTLAWATAKPEDPRLPEALHLVVRATRFGCSGKTRTPWSHQAFDLLHRRYPNSPWTKKTPYWY